MNLKNKNVFVYGLGKSGKACINFLNKQNANVFVYDDNTSLKKEYKNFVDGNFDFTKLDLAILSPAIYCGAIFEKLKSLKIPTINEIQLAYEFFKGKFIAVTGTNGKTTTVSLLGEIFKRANFDCVVCGNIGVPLISLYERDNKEKIYILEISSFQLEYVTSFKPYVSCILNIAPDHLNRHKTMENYERIKFSICKNQSRNDFLVLNENLKEASKKYKIKPKRKLFGRGGVCEEKNGIVNYNNNFVLHKSMVKLLGEKNLENVLASIIVAKIFKIKNEIIEDVVYEFTSLEHRIEFVAKIGGISFINDSKSTNVASTLCALECFKSKSVVLLVGGIGKKEDYSKIFGYDNLKCVVCYGDAKDEIYDCGLNKNFDKMLKAKNLKDAFEKAYVLSCENDFVLLSPACASFDEFSGFEERGRCFKEFINGKK